MIRSNATIHKYSSLAGFMRDKALEIDMSNRAVLAIILSYLSFHRGEFKGDKSLDWTKRKKDIKRGLRLDLSGLDKEKRKNYMDKVEETINTALKVKKDLDAILSKYYIE